MKARLRIVAVGQKKIIRALVCRVELVLRDRSNHRLARRRLGFLLNFLRADWSCQKTGNPEQSDACNSKSTHVLSPRSGLAGELNARGLGRNLTRLVPFNKLETRWLNTAPRQ
jgi:hypothetical protein